MKSFWTKAALVGVAMLSVVAIAAVPANARLSNRVGSVVQATSTNSQLNTGFTVRCPTASFTGTITGADVISGTIQFGGRTCTGFFGLVSVNVRCTGTVTITITDSRTLSAVRGSVTLDAGFSCVITPVGDACTLTVAGRQGPIANAGTYDNRQRLRVNPTGLVADGTGGTCGGRGQAASFSADYTVGAPNPLTVV
jgi:hypothetical protein